MIWMLMASLAGAAECENQQTLRAGEVTWELCDGELTRDGEVVHAGEGTPARLFLVDDEVWVELVSRRAIPVSGTASPRIMPVGPAAVPAPPTTSSAPVPAPAPSVVRSSSGDMAPILELDGRTAVVALGEAAGLKVGDAIDFMELDEGSGTRYRVRARGQVVAVGPDDARVQLLVNQSVEDTALARLSDAPLTRSRMSPPDWRNVAVWEAGLTGGFNASNSGAIFLLNGAIGYRFAAPVRVDLRVDPVPIGIDGNSASASGSVMAYVSYDHDLFAVGVGGGVSLTGDVSRFWPSGGAHGVFGQTLRAGAVDGFHFQTYAQFASVQGTWFVDKIDGRFQIPISNRGTPLWLIIHGEGGASLGRADIGLRVRAAGNGGPGTLHVTPTVGFGLAEFYSSRNGVFAVGPTLGVRVGGVFGSPTKAVWGTVR